ncbi:MAG: hypothetical protein DHS80DRAFT_22201 [Piptocephalis tieghemiana]|nr:MAG: hypothetical protein DHS80DRAFT_22201 [Piptocephalis tieghemiana]
MSTTPPAIIIKPASTSSSISQVDPSALNHRNVKERRHGLSKPSGIYPLPSPFDTPSMDMGARPRSNRTLSSGPSSSSFSSSSSPSHSPSWRSRMAQHLCVPCRGSLSDSDDENGGDEKDPDLPHTGQINRKVRHDENSADQVIPPPSRPVSTPLGGRFPPLPTSLNLSSSTSTATTMEKSLSSDPLPSPFPHTGWPSKLIGTGELQAVYSPSTSLTLTGTTASGPVKYTFHHHYRLGTRITRHTYIGLHAPSGAPVLLLHAPHPHLILSASPTSPKHRSRGLSSLVSTTSSSSSSSATATATSTAMTSSAHSISSSPPTSPLLASSNIGPGRRRSSTLHSARVPHAWDALCRIQGTGEHPGIPVVRELWCSTSSGSKHHHWWIVCALPTSPNTPEEADSAGSRVPRAKPSEWVDLSTFLSPHSSPTSFSALPITLSIFASIAQSLAELHTKAKYAHGHLHPSHILIYLPSLSRRWGQEEASLPRILLTHWHSATSISASAPMGAPPHPCYAPPEYYVGVRHDPAAHDAWALGCLGYALAHRGKEALSGLEDAELGRTRPWTATTIPEGSLRREEEQRMLDGLRNICVDGLFLSSCRERRSATWALGRSLSLLRMPSPWSGSKENRDSKILSPRESRFFSWVFTSVPGGVLHRRRSHGCHRGV